MPPSYELEHIPAAGGTPVRQSLAAWGCSVRLRRETWGIDILSLADTTTSAAFLAPVFGYLDQVVLWRDGARLWRGWVTTVAAQATPESEARPYKIQGAGWWLAKSPWMLGWTGTRTNRTVGQWVSLALQRAIFLGAPIALGTPETDYALTMMAPDLLDSDTCWTLIQRAARYAPNSAGWWDDSGEVSILRTRERADLTPISLAIGSEVTSVDELAALEESQLVAVRLIYGRWYDGVGGETWETYTRDRAGDNDATGPNVLEVRVEVDNYDAALTSVGYHIAAKLYAALGPLSWAGRLTCDESAAAAPLVRPGQALNLTGGRTEWATMAAVVAAVELAASPEADTCTIELGPPPPLGPQDCLELFRIAGQAGNAAAGHPTPYPPPTPQPQSLGEPGTYHDLNGGTGGGSPNGTIAVEARGGSWGLGGEPEFTQPQQLCPDGVTVYVPAVTASTPPKRYRRLAFSGSFVDPAGATCYNAWVTASGARTYDAATLAVTDTTTASGNNGGPLTGLSSALMPWAGPTSVLMVNDGYLCLRATRNRTISRTRREGAVCDIYDMLNCTVTTYGQPIVAELSEEDTDDDAIARLLGASPAWTAGMTGIRTVRASGITGVYRELRYRTEHTETAGAEIWREGYYATDGSWVPGRWEAITVTATKPTLTGLTPWQRYRVTVHLERRPVDEAGAPTGDGSWSAAGTREHYILANLDGEAGIDWQVEEPPAGYEIRVGDTDVEVAP